MCALPHRLVVGSLLPTWSLKGRRSYHFPFDSHLRRKRPLKGPLKGKHVQLVVRAVNGNKCKDEGDILYSQWEKKGENP